MKTINSVQIWDNGQTVEAKILNAHAVMVSLGTSATFYYQLLSQTAEGYVGSQVAQGNLTMSSDAYEQWEVDSYAWDWVASQLNLTITGDYVAPVLPVDPEVPVTEPETPAEPVEGEA
jgi:hypothetical protein